MPPPSSGLPRSLLPAPGSRHLAFLTSVLRPLTSSFFLLISSFCIQHSAFSSPPPWWTSRGVLDPNATPDDYAPVNAGQLKNMAKALYDEIEFRVPGGPSPAIYSHMEALAATPDDYVVINIGQLKNVVKPFYDFLAPFGGPAVPWPAPGPTTDDYAPANLGQLKNVFAQLDPASLLASPAMMQDTDGDGLTGAEEAALGLDSNVRDNVALSGDTPFWMSSLAGKSVSYPWGADIGENLKSKNYPEDWGWTHEYWSDDFYVPYYGATWSANWAFIDPPSASVSKSTWAKRVQSGRINSVYASRYIEFFETRDENGLIDTVEMKKIVSLYTKTGTEVDGEYYSNRYELPVPGTPGLSHLSEITCLIQPLGGLSREHQLDPGGFYELGSSFAFGVAPTDPFGYGSYLDVSQLYHLEVEAPTGASPEIWWSNYYGLKIQQVDTNQPLGARPIMAEFLVLSSDVPGVYTLRLTASLSGGTPVLLDRCRITFLKVELEQIDDNSPLGPKNRMCSNAQNKYKDVEYKTHIQPEEFLTVRATITGTAGVKFDDGTTSKTGIADGSILTLKVPDDATGTWKLTAECEQFTDFKDQEEELAFRFIKDDPIYGARVISESAQVPPNSILEDNSANGHYDFETKSRIQGQEAMITTRIHGTFGVKTAPSGLYAGQVSGTLRVSLTANLWKDEDCVSYMHFKVVDKDGKTWKWYIIAGGEKEGAALFMSGAMDWTINPTAAPPNLPWGGDSAHSCAQSTTPTLFWRSSGVKTEPLVVEIKDFEIADP